jgi:hypothetical protein
MSNTSKRVLRIVLRAAAIGCGLFLSGDLTVTGPQLVKPAQAYIGNPLTPLSFAGVACRTARRAYWYGGAAAPYYARPYPYPYAAPYPYPAPYPYAPPPYPSPYYPPY